MTDHITHIALADLHESPFNPRKRFDEAGLQELAADIKARGRILQPLLVRPRVPPLFAGDPAGAAGFELVFGHRRLRAARTAGLEVAPCMVQELTDGEVKRAQISENLHRQDVHPIEEAEGFQALIDEHNMTADLIAEEQGKSRSYVYGRLKLLALCPEVRKACLDGEIGSEVGLLIARVGGVKLQQRALADIKRRYYSPEDGGKKSFRNIRDLLVERYTLNLKDAIFDIEDEMLVGEAGHCMRCTKRSGNAPEFTDVVAGDNKTDRYSRTNTGPDVCTDPDCFDSKKKAHLKREADKLREAGRTVVDGNKARQALDTFGRIKGAFIPLKDVQAKLKKVAADKRPAVVMIQDQRTGNLVEAVATAALDEAGITTQAPQVKPQASRSSTDYEAERRERETTAQIEGQRRQALFVRAMAVIRDRERTEFDMRLIARYVVEQLDQDDDAQLFVAYNVADRDELAARIEDMSAFDVGTLMLAVAMSANLHVNPWRDDPAEYLDAVAAEYGVVLESPEPESPPLSAARAQEDGGQEAEVEVAAALADDAAPAAKAKTRSKKKAAPSAPEQDDEAGFAGHLIARAAAWPFANHGPEAA